MAFISKPNMIFTNFGRDMLCRILSKNSRVSVVALQIQYYNARFRSNIIITSSKPVALGTPLTCKSRPRTIMSRCMSVFFQPLVQCFSVDSRMSSFSLSSIEQRRYKTSKKSPKVSWA